MVKRRKIDSNLPEAEYGKTKNNGILLAGGGPVGDIYGVDTFFAGVLEEVRGVFFRYNKT